jgi:hypothetical protein
MMTRPALLLLLLALTPAGALPAAEPEDTQDSAIAVDPDAEPAVPQPSDDDARAEATEDEDTAVAGGPLDGNDTFVPSVRISEDLSVSFPVDI